MEIGKGCPERAANQQPTPIINTIQVRFSHHSKSTQTTLPLHRANQQTRARLFKTVWQTFTHPITTEPNPISVANEKKNARHHLKRRPLPRGFCFYLANNFASNACRRTTSLCWINLLFSGFMRRVAEKREGKQAQGCCFAEVLSGKGPFSRCLEPCTTHTLSFWFAVRVNGWKANERWQARWQSVLPPGGKGGGCCENINTTQPIYSPPQVGGEGGRGV